jgi:hypothetical protein
VGSSAYPPLQTAARWARSAPCRWASAKHGDEQRRHHGCNWRVGVIVWQRVEQLSIPYWLGAGAAKKATVVDLFRRDA